MGGGIELFRGRAGASGLLRILTGATEGEGRLRASDDFAA